MPRKGKDPRPPTGTREWAAKTVNVVRGCPHGCRYCYARANAVRFATIQSHEEWGTTYHHLDEQAVAKGRGKVAGGRVMFPSSHDITPQFAGACIEVMRKVLAAGNELLIVTKPHVKVVGQVRRELQQFQSRVTWRFSIGTTLDHVRQCWEPNAPTIGERITALRETFDAGWTTSVSMEPALSPWMLPQDVCFLASWVNDSIWIGTARQLRSRCSPDTPQAWIRLLEKWQTPAAVRKIYARLKDHPLVRWKDSYQQILGLHQSTATGTDR